MTEDALFEVSTPLGFSVRVTRSYWERIVKIKHPVIRGREEPVQRTLGDSDEIRRSKGDPAVYLFYRAERPGRWTCAVVKRLNDEGFLITTFPTERIKEGERVWTR